MHFSSSFYRHIYLRYTDVVLLREQLRPYFRTFDYDVILSRAITWLFENERLVLSEINFWAKVVVNKSAFHY